MNEDKKVLKAIESTIYVVSKEIKRNKGAGGDKLNAYGRLINAYGRLVREHTVKSEGYFEIPTKVKKKPDV